MLYSCYCSGTCYKLVIVVVHVIVVIQVAPEITSFEQTSRSSFRLAWSISSIADLLSYYIKRSRDGSNWSVIARDIPKQATFIETSSDLQHG